MAVLLHARSREQARQQKNLPRSKTAPQRQLIQQAFVGIALAFATAVAFSPVLRCGFVNFDDDQYLTANPVVQQGLTLPGVIWAFTTAPMNLWHPLSFISLMCDVEMFGISPAGHHAVNLLFHVANVVLLFAFLCQIFGGIWRSALVAALFALHPLRVESVAWVAERKDVLAMFFGLLALLAYRFYTRRPSIGRNALMSGLLALSLLAKPMLLPLPAVLLLLDYWPLARWTNWKQLIARVLEKLPMAIVSAAVVSTSLILVSRKPQRFSDAYVQESTQRRENAVISYVRYLEKMGRFDELAVLYPNNTAASIRQFAAAASLLLLISVGAVALRRSRPWLAVGWGWYLVALLPVIGVGPQVGFHAMADRYTYFPCIGILIALVWSIPDIGRWRMPICAGAAAVMLTLGYFTWRQIGYWKDSVTLFEHAAAVTSDNDFAELSLGRAYMEERGDVKNSIIHFENALRMRPNLSSAHDLLAVVLASQKQWDAAFAHFRSAATIDPGGAEVFNNWGSALVMSGDCEAALPEFRKAIELNKGYFEAHANLGFALAKLGRSDEAAGEYEAALMLNPTNVQVRYALESMHRQQKR